MYVGQNCTMFLMLFIFFYFMLNVVITLRMYWNILTLSHPEKSSIKVCMFFCSMFMLYVYFDYKLYGEMARSKRILWSRWSIQWHTHSNIYTHTIIHDNILSSFFLFLQHVFFVFILNSTPKKLLSDLPSIFMLLYFRGLNIRKEKRKEKPVFSILFHTRSILFCSGTQK